MTIKQEKVSVTIVIAKGSVRSDAKIHGGAVGSSDLSCKRRAVSTAPAGREGLPVFHYCWNEEVKGVGMEVED